MKSFLRSVAVAVFVLFTPNLESLAATTTPFGIGLFPGFQIPSVNSNVYGLRINPLWLKHAKVGGIDIGVAYSEATDRFIGTAITVGVHRAKAVTIFPAQIAGLANHNMDWSTIVGVQVAGAININQRGSLYGVMLAPYNSGNDIKIYGFQVGLVNQAGEIFGFQIGLVNKCKDLHGLQIGLVNFNESSFFQFMPILNFGF